MHVVRKAVSFFLLTMVAATLLAGCGGSDTNPSADPPTALFTSTVTPGNLTVSFSSAGSISADGTAATSTWSFGDQVTSTTVATTGSPVTHAYANPGNYTVTLTVTDDHGTAVDVTHTINVTGIVTTKLGVEDWNWISGSNFANNAGAFESEFTPNPRNAPSSRQLAATWYSGGKLWMFGGNGYDSYGTAGPLNDLWNCTPGTGTGTSSITNANVAIVTCVWTWVAGANHADTQGYYPSSPGTFSATSLPGSRSAAATWTDLNGNMWLFGGSGYDSVGNTGVLNDLWSFSITGQSEWVSGPNVVNDQGNATTPPSRAYAASWTDSNGNFWLFGGQSINASESVFYLNDLWCFTPSYNGNHPSCASETAGGASATPQPGTAITSGTWTQISGGTVNGSGSYGTLGAAAASNIPGARISGQTWVDGAGNLWLFGGSGYDSVGTNGSLNDVWMFNTKTRVWTYMFGWNTVGAGEVLGTQGSFGSGNMPSARLGTVGWTDSSGTILWMFGGSGTDSTGTGASSDGGGALNELWAFNTQNLEWAFVAGTNIAGEAGVYPVLPEGALTQYSVYAIPGSRLWSNLWVDSSSNVWIFGGTGDDAVGTSGYLSDLWEMTLTGKP